MVTTMDVVGSAGGPPPKPGMPYRKVEGCGEEGPADDGPAALAQGGGGVEAEGGSAPWRSGRGGAPSPRVGYSVAAGAPATVPRVGYSAAAGAPAAVPRVGYGAAAGAPAAIGGRFSTSASREEI